MTEQDDPTVAPASIEDVLKCGDQANALVRGFLGRLMRQRRSIGVALDYVLALGRDVRANCWDLAERAGHHGPHRMQALLRNYRWSWERGREMLPDLAQQALGDDPDDEIGPGVAIDETADLKRGKHRVRVSAACGGDRPIVPETVPELNDQGRVSGRVSGQSDLGVPGGAAAVSETSVSGTAIRRYGTGLSGGCGECLRAS